MYLQFDLFVVSMVSREYEVGERIPVFHDNYLNLFLDRARAVKVIFISC